MPSQPRKDVPEHVITSAEELAACCERLAACRRFGLDTEFVGEDTYHPRLCLIQLATEDALYLIDPLSAGPLDAFWRLIVDPANLVVVHAGREEVRLCRLWSGQVPGNLFDLQIAAGLVGHTYPLGHGNLVREILGVHLAKGETLTEWRTRPLTRSQIRYAFDDVRFLLAAWRELSGKLERLGRAEWAREEFARLSEAAAPEDPAPAAEERWRKLRGLGSLDRRRLAIARELYRWREEVAERQNRPARTVVRDDLIVEIARRNPTKERDLQVVRGLPKRDLEAIVAAVARARELPAEQLPRTADREQDPQPVALVSAVLSAALGDFCARNHLATNLVATTTDVKLLARAHYRGEPPPEESLLARGWRASAVLPHLTSLLHGNRSLRIVNIREEAPFAYDDCP